MKLPWNKKYLIIAFHIIITVLAIYALKYCVDFLAYVLSNLNTIFNSVGKGIGWIFSVFSVVILAFVIAYLLDPIVDFFQKKYNLVVKNNKNLKDNKQNIRTQGTLITYLLILGIIILLTTIGVIKIIKSGSNNNILESITLNIKSSVTGFINDFSNIYAKIQEFLKEGGVFDYISPHIQKFSEIMTSFFAQIADGIVGIISTIGNGIVNLLISLVIAFYFLKDKAIIKAKFEGISNTFLPKKLHNFIKNSLGDINAVFSGYIRGTLTDALIMSILISIGLSLIKVKFAVIIGFISGFSNVIPYFGALMGFLLAISVSLISGQPMQAIYSIIVMVALQQIDTIFIVPKVVGESVELSPVLVIIALFVAGQLFGLWGMVFAVPVFATVKLFASRIYERQKLKKENKQLEEV